MKIVDLNHILLKKGELRGNLPPIFRGRTILKEYNTSPHDRMVEYTPIPEFPFSEFSEYGNQFIIFDAEKRVTRTMPRDVTVSQLREMALREKSRLRQQRSRHK